MALITFDVIIATRYSRGVIRSFRDRETENLFYRRPSRRLPHHLLRAALKRLVLLDAAESLNDLRIPPGNHLEKLAGNRAGQYSIRINAQWRVCFRWEEGGPADVEIVDYHSED